MLDKLLFNFRNIKKYYYFFDLMGHLPFSAKEKAVFVRSLDSFNKMMKFLIKEDKKNNINEKIVFNLIKSKISMWDSKLDLSMYFIDENKKLINPQTIDVLVLSNDLLERQIENMSWFSKIEEIILNNKDKVLENEKKINELVNTYSNLPLNSPEYLNESKKHLEIFIENIKIMVNEKDQIPEDLQKVGENLLIKVNFLIDKIFSRKLVYKDNGKVYSKNKGQYFLTIYSLLMLEKLRIEYYLNKKDNFIQEVAEIVEIQIRLFNDDPLSFLLGENIPKEIYDNSIYYKLNCFNDYIKSYKIRIVKASIRLKLFNLYLMANIKFKDRSERLELIKVSENEFKKYSKN